MAPALAVLAVSTALSVKSSLDKGKAAEQAGNLKAAQYAKAAKASAAVGTRKSAEIRRQGAGMQSDAAAAMAASGGVTDDAGAIQTMADIEQVTDYNALSAIFEGGTKAQEQQFAGSLSKWEGKEAKRASKREAVSTVISSASKAYGMGGGGAGFTSKFSDAPR